MTDRLAGGFTVHGFGDAVKRIGTIDNALRTRIIRAAMYECIEPIYDEAVAAVPKDTGRLKQSLGKRVKTYQRGAICVGMVGPRRGYLTRPGVMSTRYAHIVEFGSRTQPGQPYLRPAWDAARLTFAQDFGAALWSRL